MGPMKLRTSVEQWPLAEPFRITGYTFEHVDVLLVTLESEGCEGRGEAAGVYYKHDTPAVMIQQVEGVRSTIEDGTSRQILQNLLPAGGARNAVDCALWDLQSKLSGQQAWEIAGLGGMNPVLTTFTCGAAEPAKMASDARAYREARAIKLKLTGEPVDAERVLAVRSARPDVWLSVDGNQGFTTRTLETLLPVLTEARVALIEQPFPIGEDGWLDSLKSPIPIAADESVQSHEDLAGLVNRFQAVNIKLDKCGGLTEALRMARTAAALGLEPMVGNMIGTSLAMAPALVVGQLCKVVDLDGPIFLKSDRDHPVSYVDGYASYEGSLWGSP